MIILKQEFSDYLLRSAVQVDKVGLYPLIVILIINFVLAILMILYGIFIKKKEASTLFIMSCFILFVPLVGPIFLLFIFFLNYLFHTKNADLSDISFSQEREVLILSPDYEKEINYVPLHDAISISDNTSLRNLLLNTMLSSAKRRISNISVAITSEDTEASHYAATIMMDVLSELQSAAQNLIENLERFPEDVEMNMLTFDYLYELLELSIMSSIEQEAYIYTLNDVAENLFKYNLWYMTADHYLKMTELFISISDYNMAYRWSLRAKKYRPNTLETYKAKLHLHYVQNDNKAFFEALDELKNSNIIVDKETLDFFHVYYSDNETLLNEEEEYDI